MLVNLYGILFSFIITLLKYFSPHICESANKKIFGNVSNANYMKLRDELRNLLKTQQTIDQVDDFAQYALVQRKINKINDQIESEIKQNRTAKLTTSSYIKVTYNAALILSSILFIWFNRDKPIVDLSSLVANPSQNTIFYPFDSLMAFPSIGHQNSVGLTAWLFTTNRLFDIALNRISRRSPVSASNRS
jgi:hypothetical protein